MTDAPRAGETAEQPTVGDDAEEVLPLDQPQVPTQAEDSSLTTADPRVADALSRLAEVDALPLGEQVEVYADIHRRLAGVLSDPDSQA